MAEQHDECECDIALIQQIYKQVVRYFFFFFQDPLMNKKLTERTATI